MARTVAREFARKREAIQETAARVFAESGYDRASMSQLATACGISKSLIYHYYTGKEALLFDILHSHLSHLLAAVRAAQHVRDQPRDTLRNQVRSLLDCYRGADDYHRLQLESMNALSKAQQSQLAGIQRKIVREFSDVIALIRPRYFQQRKEDLLPVTMSLFGMMNWFYQWHRPRSGITRERYADMVTDLLLGGVLNLGHR